MPWSVFKKLTYVCIFLTVAIFYFEIFEFSLSLNLVNWHYTIYKSECKVILIKQEFIRKTSIFIDQTSAAHLSKIQVHPIKHIWNQILRLKESRTMVRLINSIYSDFLCFLSINNRRFWRDSKRLLSRSLFRQGSEIKI